MDNQERNNYNDGYATGKAWTDDYRPGGPWRCTESNDRYADLCKRTQKDSAEWFQGFDKGLEQQKVFNRLKA